MSKYIKFFKINKGETVPLKLSKLQHRLPQQSIISMGINCGVFYIAVSQKGADAVDIHLVLVQVSGKGGPQNVGGNVHFQPCPPGILHHQLIDRAPAEGPALPCGK